MWWSGIKTLSTLYLRGYHDAVYWLYYTQSDQGGYKWSRSIEKKCIGTQHTARHSIIIILCVQVWYYYRPYIDCIAYSPPPVVMMNNANIIIISTITLHNRVRQSTFLLRLRLFVGIPRRICHWYGLPSFAKRGLWYYWEEASQHPLGTDTQPQPSQWVVTGPRNSPPAMAFC